MSGSRYRSGTPRRRRRRARLAVTAAAAAGLAIMSLASALSPASAATRDPARTRAGDQVPQNAVTFIGDSVTAGFGYCGTYENTPTVRCGTNEEIQDAWHFSFRTSLDRCAPPDPPEALTNACSNDNYYSTPWRLGAWQKGPGAPVIAYPYQIAKRQRPRTPSGPVASVSDWAITGSTPADWDADRGTYGPQLESIQDQYVVMTLGANPLLSYYTNIALGWPLSAFFNIEGQCVYSTGYKTNDGTEYSGPLSETLKCLNDKWKDLEQTKHLENIYKKLLSNDNHVLVLGYYHACPWSFGNWQPAPNVTGPATGDSCSNRRRLVRPSGNSTMTQWKQAIAVIDDVNDKIHGAVNAVRKWAMEHLPGQERYKDLAWVAPDQNAWERHQPGSAHGSWVLLNDTWIHPNEYGHEQLADTVTGAMCAHFNHWCESPPEW